MWTVLLHKLLHWSSPHPMTASHSVDAAAPAAPCHLSSAEGVVWSTTWVGHAAIFSLEGEKPINLLPGKTDIAELLLASRMQKTSISLRLIRAGNTCHFLSQLQLTCCISALIPSSLTLPKSRFKWKQYSLILFFSFKNTNLFVFIAREAQ